MAQSSPSIQVSKWVSTSDYTRTGKQNPVHVQLFLVSVTHNQVRSVRSFALYHSLSLSPSSGRPIVSFYWWWWYSAVQQRSSCLSCSRGIHAIKWNFLLFWRHLPRVNQLHFRSSKEATSTHRLGCILIFSSCRSEVGSDRISCRGISNCDRCGC